MTPSAALRYKMWNLFIRNDRINTFEKHLSPAEHFQKQTATLNENQKPLTHTHTYKHKGPYNGIPRPLPKEVNG